MKKDPHFVCALQSCCRPDRRAGAQLGWLGMQERNYPLLLVRVVVCPEPLVSVDKAAGAFRSEKVTPGGFFFCLTKRLD